MKEGSITFWLNHQNEDWFRDNNSYSFNDVHYEDILISVNKKPPRNLQLNINGIFSKQFAFNEVIPSCDKRGLFVAIVWKINWIKLYLNGDLISEISDN